MRHAALHFALISAALVASLLFASTLIACSTPPAAPVQVSDSALDERARTFVRFMAESKYEDAVKMMDAKMASAMPTDKAKQTWEALIAQVGAFDAVSGTRLAVEADFKCVYVTCSFKNAAIDTKVVFDAAGKVTGLWFTASQSVAVPYKQPPYAVTSAFAETECTIGEGKWKLPATLTMAKGDGPFPAVVLVHGSGPNDRDETIGPNKPFKDLAWGLASKGIAVLRYEKRTRQYATEIASSLGDFTVNQETVEDALEAVAFLRKTAGVDPAKVYVLGHSLGASMAPRIAVWSSKSDSTKIAGLVMLAPNARSIADLIVEQVEYIASLDGKVDDNEAAYLQQMKAELAKVREGKVQEGEIVLGGPKAYWADLTAYDPVATAKTLQVPVLLLQGERDYQVTMRDFTLWKEALGSKDGAVLTSFPSLNHLFMPGEGKSTPDEYNKQANVDGAVVNAVAEWLKGR